MTYKGEDMKLHHALLVNDIQGYLDGLDEGLVRVVLTKNGYNRRILICKDEKGLSFVENLIPWVPAKNVFDILALCDGWLVCRWFRFETPIQSECETC